MDEDGMGACGRSMRGSAGPLAAGCLVAFAVTLPQAWSVATTGVFFDPDDAMRAVEVRDFMAGQAWFDLVPHRLAPAHPFTMHWSRLLDLPLALVAWAFRLVLAPPGAELAMRLVVPPLFFVATLATMVWIARHLVGPRAALPAALLLAASTDTVSSFVPGHIHHHGVQVALLLGATASLLRAFGSAASLVSAILAGALAALSLGIGMQNLPFVVGLAAAAVGAWIIDGPGRASTLVGFGGGLAVGSLLVFGLDVPPSAWGEGACDAFSTAHLLAGGLGGALLMLIAGFSARLPRTSLRCGAAVVAAGVTLAALACLYPACLQDPMAGVDPLLRTQWLAGVGEALSLRRLIALDPIGGCALAATLATGLTATLAAAVLEPPANRIRWLTLALLSLIGVLGCLYQNRVAGSACMLMVPGLAWAVLRIYDRLVRVPRAPALLAATIAGVVGNGSAWPALASGLRAGPPAAAHTAASDRGATCFDPASYAALRAQPPGLVLSTIDPGSTILATTSHDVLAAPYHRNTAGIRASLLAFRARAAAAEQLARDEAVTYVALCQGSNEAAEAAALSPDGLAADLLGGRVPAWLQPIGDRTQPILLYRVRPAL